MTSTQTEALVVHGEGLLAMVHEQATAQQLRLAYHGGSAAMSEVRTSMPYWTTNGVRYADSPHEVVCALEEPLGPAFYALAPRGHRKFYQSEGGGLDMFLEAGAQEVFYAGEAYVAIMHVGSDFEIFNEGPPKGWPLPSPPRLPELRSPFNQTPLFNVRVSARDFMQLLEADPRSNLIIY